MHAYLYADNQNIRTLSWSAIPSLTLAQIVIELRGSSDFMEDLRGCLIRNPRPDWLADAAFADDADGTLIDVVVDDFHGLKEFPVDLSVNLADLPRVFGDGSEIEDFFSDEYVTNRSISREQLKALQDYHGEPACDEDECNGMAFVYEASFDEYAARLTIEASDSSIVERIQKAEGRFANLDIPEDIFISAVLTLNSHERGDIMGIHFGCTNCFAGQDESMEDPEFDLEAVIRALDEVASNSCLFNLENVAAVLKEAIDEFGIELDELSERLSNSVQSSEAMAELVSNLSD